MFTLKLYRRKGPETNQISSKTVAVHRVITHEIGEQVDGRYCAIELQVYGSDQNNDYETYYVGQPTKEMDAFGRQDLHLDTGPNSWWGWGLLENWEGNTSQHYRPASYG